MSEGKPFWLEALTGAELVTLDSAGKPSTVATSTLQGKHIGLYFSAHWCPPCRAFTPTLVQLYKKLNANKTPFEIVFVSSDKLEAEFAEYFAEMPWTAIPFSKPQVSRALMGKHSITGIPALLLFTPQGKLITSSGVQAARKDPSGADFPWPASHADDSIVPLPTWALVLAVGAVYYLIKLVLWPMARGVDSTALRPAGSMNVDEEVAMLQTELRRLGSPREDPPGSFGCTFGTLFDDDRCQQLFEALVGTLRAAKKRRIVDFEGQMLLKGAHDNVVVFLLVPTGSAALPPTDAAS